jgi:hypothetical protein
MVGTSGVCAQKYRKITRSTSRQARQNDTERNKDWIPNARDAKLWILNSKNQSQNEALAARVLTVSHGKNLVQD